MKGVKSAEAVIDNGEYGVRKIRFEAGRLARQASGSALAILDDETVVLSATVASKQPKEGLDFFPLTVADRTVVSSSKMASAEPDAWRASRPVSNLILRTPNSPLSMTASALFTPFTGETSLR